MTPCSWCVSKASRDPDLRQAWSEATAADIKVLSVHCGLIRDSEGELHRTWTARGLKGEHEISAAANDPVRALRGLHGGTRQSLT